MILIGTNMLKCNFSNFVLFLRMADNVKIEGWGKSANLGRYCKIIYLHGHKVLMNIYLWLNVVKTRRMYEFISSLKGGLKSLQGKEKKFLLEANNKGLTNYEIIRESDISLLTKIIKKTCDLRNENERDTPWEEPKNNKESSILENLIWQLKEKRNDLAHEPKKYSNLTEEELKEQFSVVYSIYETLLDKAFDASKRKDQFELIQFKSQMKICFEEIVLERDAITEQQCKDILELESSDDDKENNYIEAEIRNKVAKDPISGFLLSFVPPRGGLALQLINK